MKDHEKRELVNDLTKIAKDYSNTKQLRERISHCLLDGIDQLTQDLATAKGQIEMLKESNENWMEGFKAKERDLADADKDLATAQAEIARLREAVKLHIDDLDRCIDVLEIYGLDKTSEEVKKAITELTQALSQSSPSLDH